MQTLPLLENGTPCGSLQWWDEGCYMVFSLRCPWVGRSLKKAWLVTDGGGRMLLGTLQPEGDVLCLRRRISHSALRCCGMTRPTAAVINPGEAPASPTLPDGWEPLSTLTLADTELLSLLRRGGGGIWQRRGGSLFVRYPWRQGQPVPVMPLFCFASPVEDWWEINPPGSPA